MNKSLFVGLLMVMACGWLSAQKKADQPNILFIAIDDMNDWTGFLGGHPQAITPNMDKLAAKGVNFTNAHCAAPGCSPSRNALMYGIEPFHSGLYAFYNQKELPEGFLDKYTSIAQLLKQNGYQTFGSGKVHHRGANGPEEWTEFFKLKRDIKHTFAKDEGYGKGKTCFRPTLDPLEEHVDYLNTSFGVEVLAREHTDPFFLAVGIIKPHLPFNAPKQFFDLYPKEVLPPVINEHDHDDIPAVGNAWAKRQDDNRFKRDSAWNDVRRAYLACISWADYNIGRLLDALEASSYADNTIVVLWSDHGFAQGEKNHFRKFALWEETTRVPFIIYDTRPQAKVKHKDINEGVSLVNVYRTLCDFTETQAPEYVDGYSLLPLMKEKDAEAQKPAICTWGRGNYTVRDKDWRYIRYYDGGEELYNHVNDSNEWTNLANDPVYLSTKKALKSLLPVDGVPLIKSGVEPWSICISADNPLGEGNNKPVKKQKAHKKKKKAKH